MAEIKTTNYVDQAEKIISNLRDEKGKIKLTTSKIRNILSMVSELYNDTQRFREKELSDEMASRVQYLKMRVAYEAGRDGTVREFVTKANLLEEIGKIGRDKDRLIVFCHYMEALVAYHRYYGGREN